jgi:hypothetical protein
MSTRTIIALLILLGAFIALKIDHKQLVAPLINITDNKVFCTQEAKECPDGSYVGRSGPACEFSACPTKPVPTPTNPPVVNTGTVGGIVTLSPACGGPVRNPPDPGCTFKAYETSISFNGPGVTYKATSDTNGQYSIKLPAGVYKVHAQGGELYPMCPTDTITVDTDKTVVKDIDCDSGIR